jgi:hypothetical protein
VALDGEPGDVLQVLTVEHGGVEPEQVWDQHQQGRVPGAENWTGCSIMSSVCHVIKGDISYHQVCAASDITGGRVHLDVYQIDQSTSLPIGL